MTSYVNTVEIDGFTPISKTVKKRKTSKLLRKERAVAFLFILAPVISFTIFTIIPMFVALFLSFLNYDPLTMEYTFAENYGFKNYIDLFDLSGPTGREFIKCVTNTLVYIIEVPIAIGLGLLCATLANSKGCRKSNTVYRVLLYLPTVCSAVAAGIIWRVIFAYDDTAGIKYTGIINAIFGNKWNFLGDDNLVLVAIILKNSINGMGSAMILYYASMCNISKEYYEAAEMDGASGLRQFAHITFPMLTPVTFYLLIMRLAGCLQSYSDARIFAAGRGRTIVYFIWEYGINSSGGASYSLASAAAIVLGVAIMTITIIQFKLSNKWVLDL